MTNMELSVLPVAELALCQGPHEEVLIVRLDRLATPFDIRMAKGMAPFKLSATAMSDEKGKGWVWVRLSTELSNALGDYILSQGLEGDWLYFDGLAKNWEQEP